jgi:diguanylate cyclase (GGDEF)-like protein
MIKSPLEFLKNKSTLVILLIIGIVISVYAGKLIYDRETDAIKLSFRGVFSDKVQALQRELFLTEEVVHGLKSLYDCSENVEYDEFKTMVDSFLLRHGGRIKGLSWNPRLWANQIDQSALDYDPTFLETIRKDFPDFEITERDEQNKLIHVDVKKRKDNFFIPVAYIEPYPSNQKAHGFDIASNAQRKESIEAARDTDLIHATPTISLVQKNTRGVLVIAPLYDGKPITIESKRELFKGVVVGVFDVGEMADKAMKSTAVRNLSFELLEGNFSSPFTLSNIDAGLFHTIYKSAEDQTEIFPQLSRFIETQTLTFANRTWGVRGTPFASYVSQRRSYAPFLVVALGGILSISVIGYLIRMLAVQQKLKQLSLQDSLTKVANKRGIIDYLNHEWDRCLRDKKSLSICMIDLDEFKKFNDTYGHIAGDRCLQEIAQALLAAVSRGVDMVGRYGGEEFCLILPNTSDPEFVAKDCLDKVADLHIPHKTSSTGDYVSISVGLATKVPEPGDSLTDLLQAADNALYQAKQAGRNQLKVAETVNKTHALVSDAFRPGYRKSSTKQPW